MELAKVITLTESMNRNTGSWKHPFNQASFFNYDINSEVTINSEVVIPKAVQDTTTLEIYPTVFRISLNQGEINDTNFIITFSSETTALLVIVHTEYVL
jgi:hypothetical protein